MSDKIKRPFLTHASGAPVADNVNIMTAGPRGPALLQDVWLIEKLAHFHREVIPERRMHAKGAGAHGTFTVTHDITRYTKASIFSEIGKQTPMFARFSTVAGERGAADAERDIRGFALKFYTDEGNWDVVGNNTPVFFFRDPLRFIDLNHAIKRHPRTGVRDPDMNWDFWTLLPEALHQVTIVMSERGIPKSFRHQHGFGSHTYSMINANNERVWVKFHFRTRQGVQNLTDAEAEALIGKDRESHQRDLFNSIERGDFPRWTLFIQVMTDAQAKAFAFNPFDLTKVWPKADYPLIEVGHFELNRNPENVFAEVEQAAFTPANVVPGIGYSPDKMLQARLFSYGDAQRYRLGVNHHQIPVNAPKCPFHSYHRDGAMRTDGNLGGTLTYWPNSHGEWTDQPQLNEPPLEISGAAGHWDHRVDDDHWQQPGDLFRKMNAAQKKALFDNTARQVGQASKHIQERHVANCGKADPAYGKGVADALAKFAAGKL
ncbi:MULTISPECIES: catalase [unclassified Bradyrhizobium]|uniref:catalase n=1 Tax=unclassified Bradyrhizobium TaxID=2631580 RepID=UPI001BA811E6|nr:MULTISPECIES: catalase [unclassified Bradyrhizobium]MBR1202859.1 catalase [Bradyrhizobium sp. AUGA SZCCT0124]MBR1314273.1 catalase [Bradyrhizobium sp. AUGA SZCCT0051]MBR1342709.1 catalase [Bradyrhizobium sp. AUGA SZCCT0105]MBR1352938.1 catalase [Bradyrhizobium sp. AUGA SZCCT0045]